MLANRHKLFFAAGIAGIALLVACNKENSTVTPTPAPTPTPIDAVSAVLNLSATYFQIRGTYAALAHPSVISHLTDLGITAIELMPVHQFVQDTTLVAKGLSNYWGYNTIGFFAPHNAYSLA